MRPFVLPALLGLSFAAAAPTGRAYYLDLTYKPARFVCDGTRAKVVAFAPLPGADGTLDILSFGKPSSFPRTTASYKLGLPEGAAGSTYRPLTPLDANAGLVPPPYFLRESNVRSPQNGETTTQVSVKTDSFDEDCRWLPGTRAEIITGRRGVYVIQQGASFTYRSFNFGGGGVTIIGGMREMAGNVERYRFQNGGYAYSVEVALPGAKPFARVVVMRGGKLVQTEAPRAYLVSR